MSSPSLVDNLSDSALGSPLPNSVLNTGLSASPSVHKEWFEPIPEDSRFTTLPIGRPALFDMYQTQLMVFWTVNEVDLSKDAEQYTNVLNEGERRAVRHILGFFASSDSLVNINILSRFRDDVPMPEANYFYNIQTSIEDVHAHMYSLTLDSIIPDKTERDQLINAAKTMPVIEKMIAYIMGTINSDEAFPRRLLRMACVEGIFFTGCFCIIYWFGSRGNLMPGLVQSNELIARDEGLHTKFALMLYTMIKKEYLLNTNEIAEIIEEAVDISLEFTLAALPDAMEEMNVNLMTEYIKLMGNNVAAMIGEDPVYQGVTNPFPFMNQLNQQRKALFFEKRATQYSKKIMSSGSTNSVNASNVGILQKLPTPVDSQSPSEQSAKAPIKRGYTKGMF